jgi:hypothetical protein
MRTATIADWVQSLSIVARSLLATWLLVLGMGNLIAGRLITLGGGWLAWGLRVVLFEPLGILAVLACGVVAWPRSRFSAYISEALARRRYAAAVGVVLALGAILEITRWLARQAVVSG